MRNELAGVGGLFAFLNSSQDGNALGEIVERGTHDALLLRDGRYKQLHDKQYDFERDRFVNPGEDPGPVPEVAIGATP